MSRFNREIVSQTYSNRVLRSEFDRNWVTSISETGYVIYTATSNHAKVEVLLEGGSGKRLIFRKGGKVLVGGGGVSHYSKPHVVISL
ncbi:hypothetical protein ACK8P5_02325 [Paenibacillus sp. EC2-1]|uniref:hypothetical protein n=1 Tax=Paenibacillus sp. EC2-1 TaxID=3388665 RepID=UPI003BEF34C9